MQIYSWIQTLISVHVAYLEISLTFDGFLISYSTSCLLDVTTSAYLLTPMYECVSPHLNVTQTHTCFSVSLPRKGFPEAVCDHEEALKICGHSSQTKAYENKAKYIFSQGLDCTDCTHFYLLLQPWRSVSLQINTNKIEVFFPVSS